MAKGARMSVLPVSQRCGRAAELSAISSGENALAGTAWHARNLQPGSEAAAEALSKLTDAERAEVDSWQAPTDIETPHGWLRYSEAQTELELGLDASGEYCDPSHPDCITVGHMDMGWVLEHPTYGRCAYVADAKRSEWTSADGPETLQLHSYGRAFASLHWCDTYVTGVWACIEGRWWWAERAIELSSIEGRKIADQIVRAAMRTGGAFVVGSHCRSCYGRWHCPGWLMPPEFSHTSLGPMTGDFEPTERNMLELLVAAQRMEDTAKKAKAFLSEWALKNGGIPDPSTGKKWAAVLMPGRESLDKAAMVADGIDPRKYTKTGRGFEQFRWLNNKVTP